jgi:YHS domain-containing protein
MQIRLLPFAVMAIVGFLAQATLSPALADDPVYTGIFSSLAVSGYDPVAYFTDGKPVEGSSDYEYEWKGATWRFASAANLAAFKMDPEKYAPQYGGYCAWAVSQGYTASADPDVWRIVDGKLYLNYSKDIQQKWEKDIPGNISKADTNWPKVLDK